MTFILSDSGPRYGVLERVSRSNAEAAKDAKKTVFLSGLRGLCVPARRPTVAEPESTALGREIARHFGNGFGVEDEVVPVEQARDAGPVDLHLQVANAERTKHHDSVAIHTVVGDVDPFHARRRHGVDIGDGAQSGASRPRGA